MPFDFDRVIPRQNSNSMKWGAGPALLTQAQAMAEPLPMWVADMDFRAPQPVIDALVEAAEYGVFGYPNGAAPSYVQAVVEWQGRRFGWTVNPDWVVQVSGIITAIKTAVQAFTRPGESVLIQPPVYAHFRDDVLLNGRFPVSAPLTHDGDRYRFDPALFEAAIRPDTRLFILSNPHNPTGNVWSADELREMGRICARHDILVIADEIHQDLVLNPSCRHVPFASLGPEFAAMSITCTAPSKTFNLPGLQSANLFIPSEPLRAAFQRQYDRNVFPLVNVMGMVAAEAAYRHGAPWLDALLPYLRANHSHFATAINGLNGGLRVLPADALYLAWMDCRGLGLDPAALEDFLLIKGRVWFDKGPKFGAEGHGHMRVNLGCPRATVDEAISRLKAALPAG